jgi:signal transduction histidine kinase
MRGVYPPIATGAGVGRRYLFAGAVTVLALLIALAIRHLTGSAPALLMAFFPALLAVTFYSGAIAAVFSWLFAVSAGAFAWGGSLRAPPVLPVEDRWALATFAISTALSVAIGAIARRAALAEHTELLRVEQKAQQDVGLALEDKQRALSKLSHDLRTPLSTIVGWAQVLRAQNPPEQMIHGLEVIERNARTQTRIIQELLDGPDQSGDTRAAEATTTEAKPPLARVMPTRQGPAPVMPTRSSGAKPAGDESSPHSPKDAGNLS